MLIACVAATMLCSCNNSAQAQQAQEPTTTQQQQQPVMDPIEEIFHMGIMDYSNLSESEQKELERIREIHSDKEIFSLPNNGKIVEAAKIVINDQ